MKRKINRTNNRKPAKYPAYIQELHEAFKLLARKTSTHWIKWFAENIRQAIFRMSEPGQSEFSREERMYFYAGWIELLSLFMDANERESILSLIEAVLAGEPESRDILTLIDATINKRSNRRISCVGYKLREFIQESIQTNE